MVRSRNIAATSLDIQPIVDVPSSSTPIPPATCPVPVVMSAEKPRGSVVSGRWWRDAATERSSSRKKTKALHPGYTARMEKKGVRDELKSLNNKVKEEVELAKARAQQSRESRRQYREKNKENSRVIQKIKRIDRIKKMSKKQIRKAKIVKLFG